MFLLNKQMNFRNKNLSAADREFHPVVPLIMEFISFFLSSFLLTCKLVLDHKIMFSNLVAQPAK